MTYQILSVENYYPPSRGPQDFHQCSVIGLVAPEWLQPRQGSLAEISILTFRGQVMGIRGVS